MKYAGKIPETDQDLKKSLLNKGWKQVKEPGNLYLAILLSLPFILLNGLIICLASRGTGELLLPFLNPQSVPGKYSSPCYNTS